ncbi:MAG TPA: glycosyltransferase family 39 protein [Vicinamibacteria bacterium]|nr:glycosyltransferase family 39 protein [Vicinamibacteria bacterium]
MTGEDARESARFARCLLAITLAGLVLRAVFLLLEPPARLTGDEPSWTAMAIRGLVRLRRPFSPLRSPIVFYPPGYPYFVGAFYALGGLAAVQWAQVVVGALLAPAVGRVGRTVFSPRVGLAAAALAAVYPELVWFCAHFWSETLFVALLWWGLERALAADASGRWPPAIAAGVLWGAASLTRETPLAFVPIVAIWMLVGRGRGGRARAAAFVTAATLTVVPWTWRNWVAFDAFVPVSTFGAHALWQGNTTLTREEFSRQTDAVDGAIAQFRLARERGFEAIRARQPWWLLQKVRSEMPALWGPASYVGFLVDDGAYGAAAPAMRVAAHVSVAAYLAVLAAALPGLAVLRRQRGATLLLLFAACSLALHVITFGDVRFRLPLMPVLFLAAAHAWSAWREGAFARLGRGRQALLAGLALAATIAVGSAR